MYFKYIHLVNFKCYANQKVDWHPSINCIIGSNGAGKTNLMDALYYTCFTKSYFTSSDQFVLKEQSDFFRIESCIVADKEEKIVIKAPKTGRKQLLQNDVEHTKRTDYIGQFPAVMIAPDDNQIILGGSELRRRFMSACIGQYNHGYLKVLLTYQKLVKQRNAALKQFLKRGSVDDILLQTLDEQMIEHGSLLFSHRKEFIKAFQSIFQASHQSIVKNAESVEITYKSLLDEFSFEEGLKNNRQKDLFTARSNFGPHKDDLVFTMLHQPLKSVASQGQQKSYLMALKFAQYELIKQKTKKLPFLFLDDLFDKFDEQRVQLLIGLIKAGKFGQVFITDTHQNRVALLLKKHNLDHQIIRIENASVNNG